MRSCNPGSLLPYLGICFLVSRKSQIPLICFMWFSILPLIILCHLSQEFSIFVFQSCPTLCDPMDCSTPDFPVLHHLSEPAQTNVHWVCDAIQPISSSVIPFSSHLPSFPASGSFLMSQLFATVQFSHSVVSCSLRPHGLQHTRPPCLSPTHGVNSNSYPLSWWCTPTISSSASPSPLSFSLSQQQGLFQWVSSNESGFFPMSQYFGQKFWSFSFSISPSNEYSELISFRID